MFRHFRVIHYYSSSETLVESTNKDRRECLDISCNNVELTTNLDIIPGLTVIKTTLTDKVSFVLPFKGVYLTNCFFQIGAMSYLVHLPLITKLTV